MPAKKPPPPASLGTPCLRQADAPEAIPIRVLQRASSRPQAQAPRYPPKQHHPYASKTRAAPAPACQRHARGTNYGACLAHAAPWHRSTRASATPLTALPHLLAPRITLVAQLHPAVRRPQHKHNADAHPIQKRRCNDSMQSQKLCCPRPQVGQQQQQQRPAAGSSCVLPYPQATSQAGAEPCLHSTVASTEPVEQACHPWLQEATTHPKSQAPKLPLRSC